MSETLERVDRRVLLARAEALLDDVLTLGPGHDSDADVTTYLQALERVANKITAARHQPILDLETRGIPTAGGARSTAGFLAQLLRLDPVEASGRVRAAHACGRRVTLSGEVLEPLLPLVARGQVEGVVSARVQAVITRCLAKLPADAVEYAPIAEANLVQAAATFPPQAVQQLADRISYLHDQDGALADLDRRRRNRTLTMTRRADGSCHGSFEGTAELGEFLDVALDALAAPKPESDGVKDPRTPGQRRHDALLDVLKHTMRTGQLPRTGGVTSTIVVTMSIQDYEARTGFAITGHGAQVPVTETLHWSGGDTKIMAVVLNTVRAIIAYSTTHRLFTETQRLAMTARDGGCCFPHCDAPPGWCEAHHVTEWQTSKRSSIDNGVLLCSYHHREFERLGFRLEMHHGIPVWTAPRR